MSKLRENLSKNNFEYISFLLCILIEKIENIEKTKE